MGYLENWKFPCWDESNYMNQWCGSILGARRVEFITPRCFRRFLWSHGNLENWPNKSTIIIIIIIIMRCLSKSLSFCYPNFGSLALWLYLPLALRKMTQNCWKTAWHTVQIAVKLTNSIGQETNLCKNLFAEFFLSATFPPFLSASRSR